jgi:hypothetical protein
MRIAEMRRAAITLTLNEYRREIPAFGAGDVYYNRNLYETGDILEAPRDEKSVLRQALTASLLQIIDNVTTSRADAPARVRNLWTDVTGALRTAARDSVERFLSFRESAAVIRMARREPADLRTLASLTRSESEILSRHIEELRANAHEEGRRAQSAPADENAETAREARTNVETVRVVRERARETLLELARIYSARLRASETPVRRVREQRVAEERRAASILPEFSAQGAAAGSEPARPPLDAVRITHAPVSADADDGVARETIARRNEDEAPSVSAPEAQAAANETGSIPFPRFSVPGADAETGHAHPHADTAPLTHAMPSEDADDEKTRETDARSRAADESARATPPAPADADGERTREAALRPDADTIPRALVDAARIAPPEALAPPVPEFPATGDAAETGRAHPHADTVPLTHAPPAFAGATADETRETTARRTEDAAPNADARAERREPAEDAATRVLARALEASPASVRATERETTTHTEIEREIAPRAPETAARETGTRESDETGETKAGGTGGAPMPANEMLATVLSRIAQPASPVRVTDRTETILAERERETILFAQEAAARDAREQAADTDARRGDAGGESDARQSEAALREVLDRIDRENKERLTYLQEMRTETRETIPPSQPDKRRIMRDALRAIENPAEVISETLEREAAAIAAVDAVSREETLIHADESTKRTMELLRLLQTDPAAAAAAGVAVARGPEALMEDIAAVERERAGRAAAPESTAERAAFRESVERLVERYVAPSEPSRSAPALRDAAAWETAPPIVHRRTSAPDIETLSQRREQRVTEERSLRDETTESTVRINEIRTQDERIARDIAGKSAEDIAELVNTTLMARIGTIADKVYGQLEKKLQNEKSRRGRM